MNIQRIVQKSIKKYMKKYSPKRISVVIAINSEQWGNFGNGR